MFLKSINLKQKKNTRVSSTFVLILNYLSILLSPLGESSLFLVQKVILNRFFFKSQFKEFKMIFL